MTIVTADLNRLMDNARVELPGALDGAIYLQIFNVLNMFFQKSNIWTEDITMNVTPANIRDSTIAIVPTAGKINRLMYVFDANKVQRAMGMATPGLLSFYDVPNGNEVWTARVALSVNDPVPTTGAQPFVPECPDWILTKYDDGILSGVLSRMMMQVAKSYSNPRMAAVHWRAFNDAVSLAKSEARHQNIYAAQTWRFPQNFATNHMSRRTF
jgi:hypothetical protein